MPQNQKELSAIWSQIIKKAWTDEAFKKKLLNNPNEVFKEYKVEVPQGMQVKVIEAPLNTKVIVLPPKQSGELSQAELDKVSGSGNWYAN